MTFSTLTWDLRPFLFITYLAFQMSGKKKNVTFLSIESAAFFKIGTNMRERVLGVSDRSVACFPQGYPKGKDDSLF